MFAVEIQTVLQLMVRSKFVNDKIAKTECNLTIEIPLFGWFGSQFQEFQLYTVPDMKASRVASCQLRVYDFLRETFKFFYDNRN